MSDQNKEVGELDGNKKEDWMNAKWRPMMGWMYMLVCTCDFVIFPILWSLHQAMSHGNVSSQWQPVTLQGAGLFHMAMGAVIGVAAFGRTQEKLAGASQTGTTVSTPSFGGFNNGSQSMGGAPTFSSPQAGGFSSPSSSFGPASAPTPSFGPAPSFGGAKPRGPAFAEQPEL